MRRVFIFVMLAVSVLAPKSGFGISFDPKEFDQLVAEAEQIFVGTVTGTTSRKLPAGAIVTDVIFTSLQLLKGSTSNTEISLMVLGGTVGAETVEVSGMPRFQTGITYLVFSQGNGTTIFPVVGGDQGMFQIKLNPVTGENILLNSRGMPVVSQSVLHAVAAVAAPLQDAQPVPPPIPLEVFLQAVRSRLGLR